MKFTRAVIALVSYLALSLFALAHQAADAEKSAEAAKSAEATATHFASIDRLIQEQVDNEGITGAVLLVGHKGHIVHEKAFGHKALSPRREPMTVDSIF